jgi:hypothetical protein
MRETVTKLSKVGGRQPTCKCGSKMKSEYKRFCQVCERGLQKQKLKQWLEEFDDFLVQWLMNDIEISKLRKGIGYYPSQDLDLILSFREKLVELLK